MKIYTISITLASDASMICQFFRARKRYCLEIANKTNLERMDMCSSKQEVSQQTPILPHIQDVRVK